MKDTDESIQTLFKPVVTEGTSVMKTTVGPEWVGELIEYLEKGTLPSNKKKAVQLQTKVARFTLVNGTLYKRGYMFKEEGDYILREIHEGICGSHSGARVLAHKVAKVGFYWPN